MHERPSSHARGGGRDDHATLRHYVVRYYPNPSALLHSPAVCMSNGQKDIAAKEMRPCKNYCGSIPILPHFNVDDSNNGHHDNDNNANSDATGHSHDKGGTLTNASVGTATWRQVRRSRPRIVSMGRRWSRAGTKAEF